MIIYAYNRDARVLPIAQALDFICTTACENDYMHCHLLAVAAYKGSLHLLVSWELCSNDLVEIAERIGPVMVGDFSDVHIHSADTENADDFPPVKNSQGFDVFKNGKWEQASTFIMQ